jgi:hypothetical protein
LENCSFVKSKKLHLTEEGKILIIYICNRMNVNRLSTNIKSLKTLNQKEELEIDSKFKALLSKIENN